MDRLYCFGESGNAYKVALMLTLCRQPWEPVLVDFFGRETRTAAFRDDHNAMGEAPVLERDGERMTQSGVILHRLARELRRFAPASERTAEECWRWILFDNHKFTANLATFRFLRCFSTSRVDPAVLRFMEGLARSAYAIADMHLTERPFVLGGEPTIADISMAGYVFYPSEETGLDLDADYPAISAWRGRIASLPGWRGPYDLMPRAWRSSP